MKRVVVAFIPFIIAVGLYALLFSESDVDNIKAKKTSVPGSLDKAPPSLSEEKVKTRELIKSEVRQAKLVNPSHKTQVIVNPDFDGNLWRTSHQSEAYFKQANNLPKDLKGEYYLELDLKKISQLSLGDTFNIELPHLSTAFTAEVDNIVHHTNGDRTIEANFLGMDPRNFSVMTLGDDFIYSQISTQAGSFVLQGRNGYAWIAAKGELASTHLPDD